MTTDEDRRPPATNDSTGNATRPATGTGGSVAIGSNGTEGSSGERRTVRIPWAAAAAPKIRKTLVGDLLERGVSPDVVDEAELVVSELVANAVRHARALSDGSIRVHWKVKNNVVEVEVSDGGGPTEPRPAPPTTWGTSGRGLRIVRSLAHEWGVIEEPTGRTVWASLGGPSRRRSH